MDMAILLWNLFEDRRGNKKSRIHQSERAICERRLAAVKVLNKKDVSSSRAAD